MKKGLLPPVFDPRRSVGCCSQVKLDHVLLEKMNENEQKCSQPPSVRLKCCYKMLLQDFGTIYYIFETTCGDVPTFTLVYI